MNHCGWCGRPAREPEGIILERLAAGRTICSGCGRLQLYCECVRTVSGRHAPAGRRNALYSFPELAEKVTQNERQRRTRDRREAAGLTRGDGSPRIATRRVVSWSRGPYHLPDPGSSPGFCSGCGRAIRRHRNGWRHR